MSYLKTIPKAELHVHLEGTLTPDLMFKCAKRNGIILEYKNVEELKKRYKFENLQSFLDIYYEVSSVLRTKEDFYDLTFEYLTSAHNEGVKHVEVFFDPQSHLERGINFDIFFSGISQALEEAQKEFGISFFIIMCFLRHLSEDDAFQVLDMSLPYKDKIKAIGLDSSELGHPPQKFAKLFESARNMGYLTVAHAGEEGPPSYIWDSLHILKVDRIDHGVRCSEDPELMKYLSEHRIPLTVCPFSNVKLGVFPTLEAHNIKYLFDNNLCVTINSDDPAFFGGTILENYIEVFEKLNFTQDNMKQLAKNSFLASFLPETEKNKYIEIIDNH